MDEIDRAQGYEEMERENAIHNALHGEPMNQCLGKKFCIVCGEPNDRPSRAQGWDVRADCRETPGWHLREDGI